MSTTYELQAARIEAVFTANKVPARVWQATVTPRFVRFDVTTALGVKLERATNLDEELAYSLGVRTARIYREGGVLHVEVPRATPRLVELRKLLGKLSSERIRPCTALLGIDEGGAPLLLQLTSPDVAHVLVAGTTGSGKSELLRAMLASLARRNHAGQLQMLLIDPKDRPLRAFAQLPHVRTVAVTADEAAATLTWAVGVMEQRQRGATPRYVIAIDELADLLLTGGRPIAEALTRLTQRGREAGIHVIAATQRPAAALVGGLIKANFPVRLVGSVTSPDDAKVAAGIGGTGAERLLGRGDFLLVAKGQVIRFQAAYADDAGLAALISEIGCVTRPAAAPEVVCAGGVESGVGIIAPAGLFPTVGRRAQAHPTPPHRRRPLRERYSPAELRAFFAATGGKLTEATEQAFAYKDTTTLALMRAAVQEVET